MPELTLFSSSTKNPTKDISKHRQEILSTNLNQTNDTESAGVLIWENCQDLTDWCMDTTTFASEYDFHIGESTTIKDTVTHSLGSDTSVLGKGLLTTFPPIHIDKDAIPSLSPADDEWSMVKEEIEDDNLISATPSGWLDLPALDLPEMGVMELTSKSQSNTSLPSSGKRVQDAIDILRNINVGNDNFDLISYLYEEENGISTSVNSSLTNNVKKEHEIDRISSCQSDDCQSYSSSSTSTSVIDFSEKSSNEIISTNRRQSRRVKKRKYEDDEDYIEEMPNSYYKCDQNDMYRDSQQDTYRESREKNNEASRKSRMNKKAKEIEMSVEAEKLDRDNRILKMKVEQLEKLVLTMRKTLLESALNRRNT